MATSKAAHKAMAMDSRAKHNMDLDSKGKASSRYQHQETSNKARGVAIKAWAKASSRHQALATSNKAMDVASKA